MRIITFSLAAIISVTVYAELIDPISIQDFERRRAIDPAVNKAASVADTLSVEAGNCMKFLYAYMPLADATNRTAKFYLENAVRPALKARDEMPWGKSIPPELFRHFILPLRVNNEPLDEHRTIFYDELRKRIDGMTMHDAILEINHWCHEKVSYQPSDSRTHSPLQSVSSAIGRCGEESTFTVAAMRSMSIPARQVYTPRWAHTDDNHAWVEVWCDGKWHFLGACEPEPVLDLGWFNEPAARGMLMHARVFGDYHGAGEILARQPGNTDLNVTSNYAPVDTVSVTVTDSLNNTIEDAIVSFRLYNYAELYPIAKKITGADGRASLIGGLGDLIVWATDGNMFGFKKVRIGHDRDIRIPLIYNKNTRIDVDIDLTPPIARIISVPVDRKQREENNIRLSIEDSIRNTYISSWPNVSENSIESSLIEKSRGNHATIIQAFADNKANTIGLLSSVSDKDLTDITSEIIRSHSDARNPGFSDSVFREYIMSPRIDAEELTSFRECFLNKFSQEEIRSFREKPESWGRWVKENIIADREWYPEQVTMHPEAVLESRYTSAKSRDIFFVAGARSFGIPSRIDPVSGTPQWSLNEGLWHDVIFENGRAEEYTVRSMLCLDYTPSITVEDPKYYTHYTLSKIESGNPQLLTYPDFALWSETFKNGQILDEGQYMITSGQRLADGSVLTRLCIFPLRNDNLNMPLTVREDTTKVQVIGNFNSETKFIQEGRDSEQSILSATGRGYFVLGLVKSNHEPSNHALRDIAAESYRLERLGIPIVIVYDNDPTKISTQKLPELPTCAISGIDINGKLAREINAAENLPVFIIADTFNRVVFRSTGYNIGLGKQIADILSKL